MLYFMISLHFPESLSVTLGECACTCCFQLKISVSADNSMEVWLFSCGLYVTIIQTTSLTQNVTCLVSALHYDLLRQLSVEKLVFLPFLWWISFSRIVECWCKIVSVKMSPFSLILRDHNLTFTVDVLHNKKKNAAVKFIEMLHFLCLIPVLSSVIHENETRKKYTK